MLYDAEAQSNFDQMYGIMTSLLDGYYPKREITVTSNDLPFFTPAVKSLLRRKIGRTG